jgi:hypothetical protein
MEKPWQNHGKTVLDTIMDILTVIPGLFETIDVLLSSHYPKHKTLGVKQLRKTFWSLDKQLQQWYV